MLEYGFAAVTQIRMCELVYGGLHPSQCSKALKKSSLLGFSGFCVTVRGIEIPYPMTRRETGSHMRLFKVVIFGLCCGFVLRK